VALVPWTPALVSLIADSHCFLACGDIDSVAYEYGYFNTCRYQYSSTDTYTNFDGHSQPYGLL